MKIVRALITPHGKFLIGFVATVTVFLIQNYPFGTGKYNFDGAVIAQLVTFNLVCLQMLAQLKDHFTAGYLEIDCQPFSEFAEQLKTLRQQLPRMDPIAYDGYCLLLDRWKNEIESLSSSSMRLTLQDLSNVSSTLFHRIKKHDHFRGISFISDGKFWDSADGLKYGLANKNFIDAGGKGERIFIVPRTPRNDEVINRIKSIATAHAKWDLGRNDIPRRRWVVKYLFDDEIVDIGVRYDVSIFGNGFSLLFHSHEIHRNIELVKLVLSSSEIKQHQDFAEKVSNKARVLDPHKEVEFV